MMDGGRMRYEVLQSEHFGCPSWDVVDTQAGPDDDNVMAVLYVGTDGTDDECRKHALKTASQLNAGEDT